MNYGNFVISLDFELFWGVKDSKPLRDYRENLEQVHNVIPRLLELFSKYNIHGTFATVGLLFFDTKEKMIEAIPALTPNFERVTLSNYHNNFSDVGLNQDVDKIHFGHQLIKKIASTSNQEVGTHTFSHYYCLEAGASLESFEADIKAAKKVMAQDHLAMTSLVFPRNQTAPSFLKLCKDEGIICYRGNENHWLYAPKNAKEESLIRRAGRLIDSYINISGHHTFTPKIISKELPMDIPASRFLRPFSAKLSFLDGLRLRRIKKSMSYAAKNKQTYHLWWHPHNFGVNQNENFKFLEKILDHYQELNKKFGFTSSTMTALANKITAE